jgi:hypothetical protein
MSVTSPQSRTDNHTTDPNSSAARASTAAKTIAAAVKRMMRVVRGTAMLLSAGGR